jgi:23S rRNA (adenine2503-C2)-methyltransferase
MPVNKRWPIATVINACRKYVEKTDRRVFFEYVLLDGQNDSPEHARKLGALLKGMLCHVNLIPVNPTEHGPYSRPEPQRSGAFQDILLTYGVLSTVRVEKGIDISAGCGQLRARVLAGEAAPQT